MTIQPYPRPIKAKVKKQTDDQLVKIGQLNDLVQQTNTAIASAAGGSFSKNGAKIDVISDVFNGTMVDNAGTEPFYVIDANLYNAALIEFSLYSVSGNFTYSGQANLTIGPGDTYFSQNNPVAQSINSSSQFNVWAIDMSNGIFNFLPVFTGPDGAYQLVYTMKLFRVPLFYD